jgi:hypothetical protein
VITTGKYIGQIIHTQQTHLERRTPASHAMKQTQTFPTLETANREAIGASEHLFWCPFSHRYIIEIFSGNGILEPWNGRSDKIKENFHMLLFPHRVIQ